MKTFGLHLLLALVGSYLFFLTSDWLPYNATTAGLFYLGLFALLWGTSFAYSPASFRKVPKGVSLLAFFLKEVIVANIRIAYDIITPHYHMKPTIIALPLSARTDVEIMLLACMITLTPGSLSLDLSKDRKILYVHVLYLGRKGVEEVKQSLKSGFERRLLELTA
ncbi:Na+/H+ antiporter subunit E [soil metagenome]